MPIESQEKLLVSELKNISGSTQYIPKDRKIKTLPYKLLNKYKKFKRCKRLQRTEYFRNGKTETYRRLMNEGYEKKRSYMKDLNKYKLKCKLRILTQVKMNPQMAARRFWQSMPGRQKKSQNKIDVLEKNNIQYTNTQEKNDIIVDHFKEKFKGSEIEYDNPANPTEEFNHYFTNESKLSHKDSRHIVNPITVYELNMAIKDLKNHKAPGIDKISNEMLKNSTSIFRMKLLHMYNMILQTGYCPKNWKAGNVVLIPKKPPITDINNYRPITLISNISKLFTKILASRISVSMENSSVISDLQNGFRKNRSCGDNLFILNNLLEINRSRRLKTFLLFIDLKAAYDTVDRTILISRLQKYNFPTEFILFLQDYYYNDYITSMSAGEPTKYLFQKRGLRQGCNLSPILFLIVVSDLSIDLENSKTGIEFRDKIIGHLLFADDIILIAEKEEDIVKLKRILEKWCYNFNMKISCPKSQLITDVENVEIFFEPYEDQEIQLVKEVEEYKYLGLKQKVTMRRTQWMKNGSMIESAERYSKILKSIRNTMYDFVGSSSMCRIFIWSRIYTSRYNNHNEN